MSDELNIRVTDREGREHELPALEGWRVMEIIKDFGLPLKGECGGALACATCHVYVADAWLKKLPEPIDEERGMLLDEAFEVRAGSRLSCQILMRADLNGLEVMLAPQAD